MRSLPSLALVFFLSACSKPYDPAHPVVLFDDAHHNRHSITSTYKPLARLLENDGYDVRRLEDRVEPEALRNVAVFVIPSAKSNDDTSASTAFDSEEIDVLHGWVQSGGSLLLIIDHYPFGPAVADLARRFGIETGAGMTFDPVHHDRASRDDSQLVFSRENGLLGTHPITAQVARVVTFTGDSVRAPGADVLLRLSDTAVHRTATPRIERDGGDVRVHVDFGPPIPAKGWAQAIALPYGRGRIVVFGEAAMATEQEDGGRKIGMNLPGNDNRQFVRNTFRWLARKV